MKVHFFNFEARLINDNYIFVFKRLLSNQI